MKSKIGLMVGLMLWVGAFVVMGLGGCVVQPSGDVEIVDDHGYHHHGYYDDHHDWHGWYEDENHARHDDPHDWHQ
jgi:hypothetical protein